MDATVELERRVTRSENEIVEIYGYLTRIEETQNRHSRTLSGHTRALAALSEQVTELRELVEEQRQMLEEQRARFDHHSEILDNLDDKVTEVLRVVKGAK